MKRGKVILMIVLSCVVCFALFVLVDCVRLSKAEVGAKPLITIRENIPNGEGDLSYDGLGYSVKYKMGLQQTENSKITDTASYIKEYAYGQEIWLFDKILVWGWVS